MSWKTELLVIGCIIGCFLYADGEYDIPSLNKVKFEKPLSHAPIELVKDGKLNFAIVCDLAKEQKAAIVETGKSIGPARQSLRISSAYLQKFFERTTGQKPVVLPPDSPELGKYRYKIYLGKSIHTDKLGIDITAMPPDGFKVMTCEDGIAIAGRDGSMIPGSYHWNELGNYAENGTVGAVFDFLERFLGMRFYYPGLGVVAPKITDLTITPVAYTDHPKYLTREFGHLTSAFHGKNAKSSTIIGFEKTTEWPWDNVPNDQADFRAAYRAASRPTRWMCSEGPYPSLVAKAFPDKLDICFYRDRKGILHQSFTKYTDNYFDVSNPDFAKLLAESFEKFYATKGAYSPLWDKCFRPNPEYMYFGQVDAGCVIDNERTANLKPRVPKDYNLMSEVCGQFNLHLGNYLKKSLPDKKIAVMAYANYISAPDTVKKYPDNVRVMVCSGTPVFIRDKKSEEFWKNLYGEWNKKLADKVVMYPYDPSYSQQGGIAHAIRGHFEGEFLRKMAPFTSDFAIFPCVFFSWDYYYSNYLISRAYWNPDFNAKAALEEQWKLLYGPAAPYLKEFYTLVIDRWLHHYIPKAIIAQGCIPALDFKTLYKETFPPEIIGKLRKLLDEAGKAVAPGSLEERRVSFFALPWIKLLNEANAYKSLSSPQYKIVYSNKKINVDGVLDEAIWKKAVPVTFRSAYYGEAKDLPKPDVRIAWTKEGICIGYSSETKAVPTKGIWTEDNFEFFISPGTSKNKLLQFVFSMSGQATSYSQSFDPPRALEEQKNPKVEKAFARQGNRWTAEIFIPFAALENAAKPLPGDYWFGNIVNNRTDAESTSYAPTLGNNRNMFLYSKFYFAGNCD